VVLTRRLALVAALVWLFVLATAATIARAPVPAQSGFAARSAALSEPEGHFDTDNLISNERSYLQVLPALERQTERGGAYIGVGPDQNFSYIAAVRPSIALIVDIRRDNLLLHLLFKALFSLSRTRVEYLALLLGRPVPADLDAWRDADVARLVSSMDGPRLDNPQTARLRSRVDDEIRKTGVSLSREDMATIGRFHQRFIDAGLQLRFQSHGRLPQNDYPSYRELLLGTDQAGKPGNYLASEAAFQFVKSLQARDLVVPVVGDLAGPSALAAVARFLNQRGERLSVFYVSNVEFYLFGDGRFSLFMRNLAQLPRTERSLVIRSVFRPWMYGVSAGDSSVSRIQPVTELVERFARGGIQRYGDLIAR
jgi:hypothetical protein